MKKKLLSVMLMLVMVLSVAACGKKAGADAQPTVKNVLEKISKAESNSVTCELEMKTDDGNLSFKISGSNKDGSNGYAKVEAKFNIEPYSMNDYVEFTNIYVVNDEVYINLQQMLDFLTELDSQFAMISAYLKLPGDYIVLTLDDVIELYEQMGIDTSELDFDSLKTEEWNKEYTEAIIQVFGDMFDEYASKAGETAVTVTADKVTFTVNNDNITAVLEALAAMDIENYFMDLAERIDKIDKTVGNTAAMKEEVKGWNDGIKSALEDVKANGTGDDKVNLVMTMGMNGKNMEMSLKADVESYGNTTAVNMTLQTTPDKASDFQIPSSTMSLEQLMQMLADLGIM